MNIWERTKQVIRIAVINVITDPTNIPYFIVILISIVIGIFILIFSNSRDLLLYPLQ